MGDSLLVLLTGFGVVFFGLVCLIGIIYAMSFIIRLFNHEKPAHRRTHEEIAPVQQNSAPVTLAGLEPSITPEQRRERMAVISAAIAEYLGSDIDGLRIRSIRRVGGDKLDAAQRRELIAVISAAIASELDTDVSGIRIHSIRRAPQS